MRVSSRGAGTWLGAALLVGGGIMCAAAAVPATQQAIVQSGHGGPEVLHLQTIPVLAPGDGQVLLHVHAAAVNPADWKSRQNGDGSAELVPGLDVAGWIVAVGPGVTTLKAGEGVFGVTGRGVVPGLNGGYSEYAVVPAANLVVKPSSLTYSEAAGLGTATLTGIRAIDQTQVHRAERVLITGVAGGVGSAAAQAALARGAKVIGTASARHAAYLKSIGVTEVIDYTRSDWAEQAKAARPEVIIDTVGGATADTAFGLLAKGGIFTSVGTHDYTPEHCAQSGITCPPGGSIVGGPVSTGTLLSEAVQLVNSGQLKVHIDKSYPLGEAAAAQEFNRDGHTEGKVILAIHDADRS